MLHYSRVGEDVGTFQHEVAVHDSRGRVRVQVKVLWRWWGTSHFSAVSPNDTQMRAKAATYVKVDTHVLLRWGSRVVLKNGCHEMEQNAGDESGHSTVAERDDDIRSPEIVVQLGLKVKLLLVRAERKKKSVAYKLKREASSGLLGM